MKDLLIKNINLLAKGPLPREKKDIILQKEDIEDQEAILAQNQDLGNWMLLRVIFMH